MRSHRKKGASIPCDMTQRTHDDPNSSHVPRPKFRRGSVAEHRRRSVARCGSGDVAARWSGTFVWERVADSDEQLRGSSCIVAPPPSRPAQHPLDVRFRFVQAFGQLQSSMSRISCTNQDFDLRCGDWQSPNRSECGTGGASKAGSPPDERWTADLVQEPLPSHRTLCTYRASLFNLEAGGQVMANPLSAFY